MTQNAAAWNRAHKPAIGAWNAWRFRLWALLLSLLLTFVLVEVCARIYLSYLANGASFKKYASIAQLRARYGAPLFSAHRYLGYSLTPGYSDGVNRINALGYRGDEIAAPEPSGEFRIICMGGSTIYGWPYDNYKLSLPYRLEEAFAAKGCPNVRVVNAGCPGWNTWESLIDFELRGQYLNPDLIIIDHGVNDIASRLVWPHEAYKPDDSGRRSPVAADLAYQNIFEHSVAARIFMVRAGVTLPANAIQRVLGLGHPTYYGYLFEVQRRRHVYPQGIFAQVRAMKMLQMNKPVYFEKNIRSVIALAQSVHAATVVCSFPYSTLFTDNPHASSPEYIFAYGEMNALGKTIATDTGSYFYDLAAAVPANNCFWVDGEHLGEQGNRLAADRLSDYLIGEHLIRSVGR